MTAARQPSPSPAVVALCGVCRHELACPRCDRPEIVKDIPPARLALTMAEAAEALGVSPETIAKWERERGLPVLRVERVVRVPVAALETWMEKYR